MKDSDLTSASSPETEASPSVRWLMLAGVWLLYASFGLAATSLAPLVTPITRGLGMSHGAMGVVLGCWQLVYIASAVPCGSLLDRMGPRWALLLGVLLIAASGFLRTVAVDGITLALAVGVFGLGGPIVSAGAPKVVSLWFRGRDRGLAMGIYITGPAVGGIVALSLTNSVLMPAFGFEWRYVLLLWAGFALAAGAAWLAITAHPASQLMEERIRSEPRTPQREVLKTLWHLPAVRIMLAMSVGIFLFNHGLNNWLPELLRASGMTATEAGYWAAIPTAVGIAGSLLIPRLATPGRRLKVLALLCAAAGLASLCLHADTGPVLLGGLVLQGIARSSLMTVAILTLVELRGVGERYAGTASGLFFSAAEIGGASGPVMLGVLYDATGGFDVALLMLTAVTVLLLFGVAGLRRTGDTGSG